MRAVSSGRRGLTCEARAVGKPRVDSLRPSRRLARPIPRMTPLRFGTWPTYSPQCQRDVLALLRRGGGLTAYRSNPTFPHGPRAGSWAWRFERRAEQMFGVQHVVACNSGTMALQAMLYASGLPKGATVVTSPFTFSATPAAILHAGLQPVFADVNPQTFCLAPSTVSDSDAVMPVDLFGRVAPRAYSGMILADSCQAVGAYQGMAHALAAAWSLNGQKNVPAGEAGAIVTDDSDVAQRARRFVSHGENWGGLDVGLNGRLNELTACVAYHGLVALPARNAQRRRLALALWEHLQDETRVRVLTPEEIRTHALYVFPLVVREGVDRRAFVRRLKQMGVEAGEGYIIPALHKYPAFHAAVRTPLPVVEELSERSLVLLFQVRPPATVRHMAYMAMAIRAALDAVPRTRGPLLGRVDPSAF